MSVIMGGGQALQRPYTEGTFQKRLDEFQELIREMTLKDVEATPDERRKMITENLRFDQFCDSIRALFGNDIKNQDLKALYRKISTNPDAPVDWSELFGYFQSEGEAEEVAVGEEVSVFTVSARARVGDAAGDKKRRDVVVCMRYVPSLDCFLSGSQKGAVCVWSNKLRLQACTELNEAAWLTGLDFIPNTRRLVACTERSICIWDIRTKGKNQQVFTIKPIDNSPQCVCSVPYTKSAHEDAILFGDDQGYLSLMVIAAKDLNMKNSRDKKDTALLTLDPEKLSYPIRKKKMHDDWVLKIKYFPELHCFASCSPSSTASFVLDEVDRVFPDERVKKKEDKWDKLRRAKENAEIRGVGIPKGVNAFDYCTRANVLATGGVDKVIRVWHPHIWTRPTGKLLGHLFTIVDICCNDKDQHIISLSTARVLRVWDIHTLTCLQVFTDNDDRPGEKRIYCTLFDNRHDRLLTGSSVIDMWPLTRAIQDTMQVPQSHDRPITQVVFNQDLNQVISVCSESVIKVWEGETGKLLYQIGQPHGPGIEVTCITLDSTGYRLATGGFNGSLKVWDFGSGQEIKHRAGKGTDDNDLSIVALNFCDILGKRCLISLGWNNHLCIWEDSKDTGEFPLLKSFNDILYTRRIVSAMRNEFNSKSPLPSIGSPPGSGQVTKVFSKENVLTKYELTCAVIQNDLLVTGTMQGPLVFWNIPDAVVAKVVELPPADLDDDSPGPEDTMDDLRGQWTARGLEPPEKPRGVTAMAFLIHKTRKLDPEFIKSLTKHLSDIEDSDDEDSTRGKRRSKRQSRASRMSRHSRSTSRATSSMSRAAESGMLDQATIEQLKNKMVNEAMKSEGRSDEKGTEDQRTAEKAGEHRGGEGGEAHDPTKAGAGNQAMNPDDDNPDAHMIIESFDPVLVTCHMDGYMRFWDIQGVLLRELSTMTHPHASAVTALCYDEDVNILVTGDTKGYLTLWSVGDFLEDPEAERRDNIKQIVSWRGHQSKIVQMTYIESTKAMISGSSDGSVRVWWGKKGRFVGYFGQVRALLFPQNEENASSPILPYDITEKPMAPIRSHSAKQKQQQKYEYPLIFDRQRWEPYRKSAFERLHHQPEDKKFFEALVKPKLDKTELEGSTTGEMRAGAVFRALPVYTIKPLDDPPDPPQLSIQSNVDTHRNTTIPGHALQAHKALQKFKENVNTGDSSKKSVAKKPRL